MDEAFGKDLSAARTKRGVSRVLACLLGFLLISPASAVGEDALERAKRLNTEAMTLYRQSRYTEALSKAREALEIREQASGPTHLDVATSLNNLAGLLQTTGDYGAARPLYERALRIKEQALGPTHPEVALSLNALAGLLKTTGDHAAARPLYERARRIALLVTRRNTGLDDESLRRLAQTDAAALHRYLGLLADVAAWSSLDTAPGRAAADAFVVGEQLRTGAAHTALARAGARAAAASPATTTLARQVQELRDRRTALGRQLVSEYGRAEAQRSPGRLAGLQQAADRLDRELDTATEKLTAGFPGYAQLMTPEPIDPGEVQRLLRPDEALVSFMTLDKQVLVWVVRPGGSSYATASIGKSDLRSLAARVRASVDQRQNPSLALGQFLPFDVAGARELFARLIAPLASNLAGVRHLLFVPDDVLLPVPFGALLTRADSDGYRRLADLHAKRQSPSPNDLTDYAQLAWLAKDYAITVLPSATSLKALRGLARTTVADREPLIGFGDPVLGNAGRDRGGAMLAPRDGRAVASEVRTMNRLPATRDELVAITRALGADPDRSLFLGDRATKLAVLALDASGRLGRARVLAFATHGLIGGEVTGLKQPALVLTPPATASDQDDGLLKLDDIVGLRLTGTEWVILSACNTAAGDGSGEGLSGLARGFFFAGAPALLVSHWSVEDRATQRLMPEGFRRYAADPAMPRAEALGAVLPRR